MKKRENRKNRKYSIIAVVTAAFMAAGIVICGCGSSPTASGASHAEGREAAAGASAAETAEKAAGTAPAELPPETAETAAAAVLSSETVETAAEELSQEAAGQAGEAPLSDAASAFAGASLPEEEDPERGGAASAQAASEAPVLLDYIDAWEEWHTMEVNPAVRANRYDPDGFIFGEGDPQWTSYQGKTETVECLQGVDVSEHQGDIDWNAVAEAGWRFAFIRVGYRGYGEEGNLYEDGKAVENLQNAKAAGLEVGAYFFSQALSVEEAKQEAQVAAGVLEKAGVRLDLPLMYDPETIKDDRGRANEITREQVARNTEAFRQEAQRLYDCVVDIYANLPWEDNFFDAETMNRFEIWYADYEKLPQTPYHFTWWQYSNQGTVPGISGSVDLNLWIR